MVYITEMNELNGEDDDVEVGEESDYDDEYEFTDGVIDSVINIGGAITGELQSLIYYAKIIGYPLFFSVGAIALLQLYEMKSPYGHGNNGVGFIPSVLNTPDNNNNDDDIEEDYEQMIGEYESGIPDE